MMDADDSERKLFSLNSLNEQLKRDSNLYHRVASLCLLIVKGTSNEIKENAKNQLEDFLSPALSVIPNTLDNITAIYLVNIPKAQDLWVLSVPAHYAAFSDKNGIVYIASMN